MRTGRFACKIREGQEENISIISTDQMYTDEQGNVNRYKLTERQQKILDEIQTNPAIQVEELLEKLSVSRSTVMREIQEIKKSIPLNYDKKVQRWIVH